MGQDDTQDVDSRVYDFLPLLHGRHWGSPLHSSGTSGESTIDDLDIGAYDSPNPRDVCLGLLDVVPTLNSAGRCVAEYSMRGIAKNRRRSEAAKIVRGLEGLKTVLDEKSKSSQVTPTAKVADVLRIKLRRLEADKKPVDANKVCLMKLTRVLYHRDMCTDEPLRPLPIRSQNQQPQQQACSTSHSRIVSAKRERVSHCRTRPEVSSDNPAAGN